MHSILVRTAREKSHLTAPLARVSYIYFITVDIVYVIQILPVTIVAKNLASTFEALMH